jgi:hypothetical protein
VYDENIAGLYLKSVSMSKCLTSAFAEFRKHAAFSKGQNSNTLSEKAGTIRFDTFSAYGAAVDKLSADPAAQAWQAKRLKLRATSWARGNIATEIEI